MNFYKSLHDNLKYDLVFILLIDMHINMYSWFFLSYNFGGILNSENTRGLEVPAWDKFH